MSIIAPQAARTPTNVVISLRHTTTNDDSLATNDKSPIVLPLSSQPSDGGILSPAQFCRRTIDHDSESRRHRPLGPGSPACSRTALETYHGRAIAEFRCAVRPRAREAADALVSEACGGECSCLGMDAGQCAKVFTEQQARSSMHIVTARTLDRPPVRNRGLATTNRIPSLRARTATPNERGPHHTGLRAILSAGNTGLDYQKYA
jgi:hypothetical protein